MKLELGNVSLQEIDLKSEDSGDEVSDARHTGPARFNGFFVFPIRLFLFLSMSSTSSCSDSVEMMRVKCELFISK